MSEEIKPHFGQLEFFIDGKWQLLNVILSEIFKEPSRDDYPWRVWDGEKWIGGNQNGIKLDLILR